MNNEEQKTLQTISVIWNCNFTEATKKYPTIDGIFTRDNELKGLYSVKSRTQTLSWFYDYKSIIISIDKVLNGAQLSSILKCPYFVVFRTSCKKIILFQITDSNGNIVCDMNIRGQIKDKEKEIKSSAFLMIQENPNCYIFDEEKYEEQVDIRYNSKEEQDT